MTIGDKLSELRKQKGFSQEHVASLLNVTRQSVSKWENSIALPETQKLIELSSLYEVSLDYLVKDDLESIQSVSQIESKSISRLNFSTVIGLLYAGLELLFSLLPIIHIETGVSSNFVRPFSPSEGFQSLSMIQMLTFSPTTLGNLLILLLFIVIITGLVINVSMLRIPESKVFKTIRIGLTTVEILTWTYMLLFLIETFTLWIILWFVLSITYYVVIWTEYIRKPRFD